MADDFYKSDFILLQLVKSMLQPPFKLISEINSLQVPNGCPFKIISIYI